MTFQKSVTGHVGSLGNMQRGQLTFRDHVRATYGPVDTWDAELKTTDPRRLGPNGFMAQCDQLSVAQTLTPTSSRTSIWLEAVDNAKVEGIDYTALGKRITYDQAREMVILEGDGRNNAELYLELQPGAARTPIAAQKCGTRPKRIATHSTVRSRSISINFPMESRSSRESLAFRYAEFFFFLVLWLGLLVAGRSAMFRDPGTFWHVAAGEKMLAAGQVLRHDPFSFTLAGQALGGRPMAGRVRHGDRPSAGRLGRAAVVDRRPVGRHLRVHRRPASSFRSAHASHLLAAGPGAAGRFAAVPCPPAGADHRPAEPQLRVVGRRRSRPQTARQLWWLVPLFVVWANVHGGVLAGMGTVGLCVLGWWIAWALGKNLQSAGRGDAAEAMLLCWRFSLHLC